MGYRNYLFEPEYWLLGLKEPRKALQNLRVLLFHRDMYAVARNVEGLISAYLGFALNRTVLRVAQVPGDVVEVGAFKGLSTVFISRACAQVGKRLQSFELFTGLPSSDPVLDPAFSKGQFSSQIEQYESNVRQYGRREVVDLHAGDARQNIPLALNGKGFSMAFLDVDVYDVTRDLLMLLWPMTRGGEVIIVHDAWSPGVRKAIDEFHAYTKHATRESAPERGTAMLSVPPR